MEVEAPWGVFSLFRKKSLIDSVDVLERSLDASGVSQVEVDVYGVVCTESTTVTDCGSIVEAGSADVGSADVTSAGAGDGDVAVMQVEDWSDASWADDSVLVSLVDLTGNCGVAISKAASEIISGEKG